MVILFGGICKTLNSIKGDTKSIFESIKPNKSFMTVGPGRH